MRNEQMPHESLKGFRMGSNAGGIYGGNQHTGIGHLGGVSPISADDAAHSGAHALAVLQRLHKICADIPLQISATYGKDEEHVAGFEPAATQPIFVRRIPSFVIYPGSQFGDVVGWRIGFDSRNLAKIIHGVRSVSGASAPAQEKQPAAPIPEASDQFRRSLNRILVD